MNIFYRCITIVLVLFNLPVQAAKLNVEFIKTTEYKDIYSGGNQHQGKFEDKLFSVLKTSFQSNTEKLEDNYSLNISMLDIDLAGDVPRGLGFGQDIRQISDKDFPRLLFYMVLEDEKGNIVLQGRQNLKNGKIRHDVFRTKGSQSDFYLETDLITQWFDSALIPKIAKLSMNK